MKSKGQRWFRAYAADVDDANLRLLAFEDRWHWHAINCLKCAGELDSVDSGPLLQRKIAVKLGLQLRELEAVAMRLAEFELIDPKTFQPLDWDERQFLSDTSTGRVQAFRERQKNHRNGDETFQKRRTKHPSKREGNVSETAPDTDTDTDTEKTTTALGALDLNAKGLQGLDPVVVVKKLGGIALSVQQDVLDELAGRIEDGKASSPLGLLDSLVQATENGTFNLSRGLRVRAERKQRREAARKAIADELDEVIRKAENDLRLKLIDEDERNRIVSEARERLRIAA